MYMAVMLPLTSQQEMMPRKGEKLIFSEFKEGTDLQTSSRCPELLPGLALSLSCSP